jgi:hypothetical protein
MLMQRSDETGIRNVEKLFPSLLRSTDVEEAEVGKLQV